MAGIPGAAYAAVGVLPASTPTAATGCGLTRAPQAFNLSARPAARMTLAALWSRSWTTRQAGHIHCRICSGSSVSRCPHMEQVLLDANHRDTALTVRP